MKKILITGENSFVGNSFAKWVVQFPEEYLVEFISVRSDEWRSKSFSDFDSILHVAGIVHATGDRFSDSVYDTVNRVLTRELAEKAKIEGVSQFIFMSTMSVYGEKFGAYTRITNSTIPKPSNDYGISKMNAEKDLLEIEDELFKVCIIRPPMIYGFGAKGNYPKLVGLAKKTPVFPKLKNERSMLHVDNLAEFIRFMVDNNESGTFFPQNEEYVNTHEMVRLVAVEHKKRIVFTKMFNLFIKVTIPKVGVVNKVFGSLVYDKEMSQYDRGNYWVSNFEDSIRKSEFRK